MRLEGTRSALIYSALGLSCTLESGGADGPSEEIDVATQAQQSQPRLECSFDSPFDRFGAPTCFADQPANVRTLTFVFRDSRKNLRFDWSDIRSDPPAGNLGIPLFERLQGSCGPADNVCNIRAGAGFEQRKFQARLSVVDTNVSPTPVETYVVTGIINPLRMLQACTFNGVSVPSGTSVIAFASTTAPVCEYCTSQYRTCTDGVLSGYYAYSYCTPRRLRPGEQCP